MDTSRFSALRNIRPDALQDVRRLQCSQNVPRLCDPPSVVVGISRREKIAHNTTRTVRRFQDSGAAISEGCGLRRRGGLNIDVDALPFETSYGRTSMEYYDGFVFGFSSNAGLNIPPVATGGRYDALTVVLGNGTGVPAVGGVIRPDLVAFVEAAQ